MFEELHNWLIIGTDLNKTLELINDWAFSLSTDFFIAIVKENNYQLYEIYNSGKYRGGTLNISFVGEWNRENGFSNSIIIDKKLRWNLKGLNVLFRSLVSTFVIKSSSGAF